MSDKADAYLRVDQSWERWELSAFDKPVAPVRKKETPTAPTAAQLRIEIERLQAAATASGHAEGFAAGHAQGLAAGTEKGRAQGHQQGYGEGLRAGHAAGQDAAQHEAQQLQTLALACAEAVATVEAEMGQALISLAISIAEQVLRSTLEAHPEKIVDLVRDITRIDTSKEAVLRLRVHPADLDLVQQYLHSDHAVTQWRLEADASIARGGCVAVTTLGNIDATLQTRWQRVTSVLGHASSLPTGAE